MTAKHDDAKIKDGPAPESAEVTGDQVTDYLRHHPDFLADNPRIVESLTLPARWSDDKVVDIQQFALEHLRGEIDNLRSCAMDLIDTSRGNLSSQTHTHGAVLALIGAKTFEQLMRVVSDQMPLLLDIDVVTVGFEPGPAPLPGLVAAEVRGLPKGTVDDLMGKGQDVVLHHEMADDGTVFAAGAGLVRSAALARLHPATDRPVGLLALGSRGDGVFHTGQGTDLVIFLARVLERCIERCLEG
ncbi:MAG: DUF484 family protein [Rhodospirillales bacterium]|jgi:hypothetical protein|nr:DUF484 family protein [Rhodospirillales bacterium]